MNEKKYKSLKDDIYLYTISNVGHKFLAFLLVPLYTSFMSTLEYGKVDLVTTSMNLLVPLFTLNIQESVLRFTLTNKEDKRFLSQGVKTETKGFAILMVLLATVYYIPVVASYRQLIIWTMLLCLLNACYLMQQAYLRATDRLRIIVGGSLINSTFMLVSNAIFIAIFKLGDFGYCLGMVIGYVSAIAYMNLRGKIHRDINMRGSMTESEYKEMKAYCIPTVITGIAWWVNSSLDRYFVSSLCGVALNGIYSVAGKIPAIMSVFNGIFGSAWSISAIKEFDPNDSDGYFGNVYETYQSGMVMVCSLLIIFNIILSKLLYAKEFFVAWKYVPFLLVATLFSALGGYFGGIFAALKKMKVMAYSTIISACVNIVLNIILITKYHVQGAAVATLVSYIVAWGSRYIVSRRYIKMKASVFRELLGYVALIIQAIISMRERHGYIIQLFLLLFIIILYFSKIKKITAMITINIKKRFCFMYRR